MNGENLPTNFGVFGNWWFHRVKIIRGELILQKYGLHIQLTGFEVFDSSYGRQWRDGSHKTVSVVFRRFMDCQLHFVALDNAQSIVFRMNISK